MCLAIPGKVVTVSKNKTTGSTAPVGFEALWGEVVFSENPDDKTQGVRRKVNLSYVPDIEIGEYVIVHAGFAISQLDREEAHATLSAFGSAFGSAFEPSAGDLDDVSPEVEEQR